MAPDKKKATTSKMDPPVQWPSEVVKLYDPVRILGKGGFASVVLAKKKNPQKGEKDKLVAIKVVGGKETTDSELGYAHREMNIIKELSHPHIMRLVDFWEPPLEDHHRSAAVMALSYAKGPTLEALLKKGGAPTLVFGQVVMAQLVDAVAYLHSHAVLHRDIKPDNLIVTGATSLQDEIWDDNNIDTPDLEKLRNKWHITLIDFGFARALTRDEIDVDVGLRNSMVGTQRPVRSDNSRFTNLNEPLDMSSSNKREDEDSSRHSIGSSGRSSASKRLDRSNSRQIVRSMSALGNRWFAAPEIINGVHKESLANKDGNTLSAFVSDYGMVADAFSVGATIRYTLTGVPPAENVEEVIAAQKNPMAKAARWLGKKVNKPKEGAPKKRKKKYRSSSEFPAEVKRLVQGLTHWNPKERTTVRTARNYHWIQDALEDSGHYNRKEIQFLECAPRINDLVDESNDEMIP